MALTMSKTALIHMHKTIREYIYGATRNCGNANIIIAGCSCSGKTTLANEIKEFFDKSIGVTVIHEDDYFKNLADLPKTRMGILADRIDAFHAQEYLNDCMNLLKNGEANIPVYDKSINMRTGMKKVKRNRINVFEGLHSIDILGKKVGGLKIFMGTPYEICLERRMQRDEKDWGIPSEKVERYWNACILPVSVFNIAPQINSADIVI